MKTLLEYVSLLTTGIMLVLFAKPFYKQTGTDRQGDRGTNPHIGRYESGSCAMQSYEPFANFHVTP